MIRKRLRVVIVDDSAICREILRDILEAEGDMTVLGEAEDGAGATEVVTRVKPDVVLMDIEMPRVNGLDAVSAIMKSVPVPILIVTGRPPAFRTAVLFEALRRGALDVMSKPSLARGEEAIALRGVVRRIAAVPVMRHVAGAPKPASVYPPPKTVKRRGPIRVIGIGASAGGPGAVATVLAAFPRGAPVSILVAQHLLGGFSNAYADFLKQHITLQVEVVTARTSLRPGVVFIAPEDSHIVVADPDHVSIATSPPENGHRPSIDMLFRSIAQHVGPSAAGVILSGMGRDGTSGLGAMRRSGSATFAQDWETAAVFGMPRAAAESAAADRILPVEDLGPALLALLDTIGKDP